jgi:NADH:ubiquinone oxidoreductase subunit 5 (subunit L)/multisubunit Na+/H+ antiporter MnhA subunit
VAGVRGVAGARIGVVVGLATAFYAAAVVRVHTDAKGALAHATLAQVASSSPRSVSG